VETAAVLGRGRFFYAFGYGALRVVLEKCRIFQPLRCY
jgi:hypothetical protein